MAKEEQVHTEDKSSSVLASFMTGNFLSHSKIINNIPYVFFITFICILYIANGYYSEKSVKKLYRITNEIKELRSEYISNKSDLELIKQQSHVAFSIQSLELKESLVPPNKIILKKRDQ